MRQSGPMTTVAADDLPGPATSPSTGRPAPAKVRPARPRQRAGRLASTGRADAPARPSVPPALRGRRVALGIGVLFVANGGVGSGGVPRFDPRWLRRRHFDGAQPVRAATDRRDGAGPRLAGGALHERADRRPGRPSAENLVGADGYRIRVYVAVGDQAPGQFAELPIGATARFVVAGVELSEGRTRSRRRLPGRRVSPNHRPRSPTSWT